MKGKKFRYDEKKLGKSSALKKQIALLLATEHYNNSAKDLSIPEILAFGLKTRPFVSYSDKELIRLFDESYSSKHEQLTQQKEYLAQRERDGHRLMWAYKAEIEKLEKYLKEMQPIVDALIEEAFSE